MVYKLSKLSSGLRILTATMPRSESATLSIWVKTGSRSENQKKLGISHFLEHLFFKGSKKYPSQTDIFEIFDSMGAEHNAGTSKEWTNFWVKLPTAELEKGFDVLSDVLVNPLFDTTEMERERKVIFEEMKMYEDTPMRNIVDVYEELIFQGNSLGWDTIGTFESMNRVKRADLITYRRKNYFPKNILISVTGGTEHKKTLALADKYFGGQPFFSGGKGFDGSSPSLFRSSQSKPQLRLKYKKTDQAHFMLGFLTAGRNYEYRFAQAVLAAILGGGGSSRLWVEVREKRGLAYAVSGALDRYSDAGNFGVYVGTGLDKIYEAVETVLEQVYGLSDGRLKVGRGEVEKAKGYLKGRLALNLEDSEYVNGYFSEQVLFDKSILKPEEMFRAIDKVTTNEVYKEAEKLFLPEHLNLAIIGPYKDANRFRKLLK